MTEEQYKALVASDDACLHGINELKTQIGILLRLMNGSTDEDIKGVRPRLAHVEQQLSELSRWYTPELATDIKSVIKERNELRIRMQTVIWLIGGLSTLTGLTLAGVVRMLFG